MPGSTNIQQWNPGANNQENDAAYTADPQRAGGAVSGTFPSQTANKLFFQLAQICAALAQMLANKGYTVSDSNFANLVGALNNILTFVDVPTIFTNPTFTGDPKAPTPPLGDNDTSVATTAFVNSLLGAASGFVFSHSGFNGYIKFPSVLGGLIVQWVKGAANPSSGETYETISFPISFPNSCLNVQVTMAQTSDVGPSADCWYQIISFTVASVRIFKQGTGAALPSTTAYVLAVGW